MPELPEVETVVRDLRPLLTGRQVLQLRLGRKSLRRKWRPEWTVRLTGRTIRQLRRRGKWIVLELDEGALLVHLGMTGQLTAVPTSQPTENHTHLLADLDGGTQLRFRDVRRFGSITYFESPGDVDEFLSARLGPEPFDLKPAQFYATLSTAHRPLKAILLDQTVVAGVGNIYADESLFEARLPPTQHGCDTTVAEARRLLRAIVRILTRAIQYRGSTIRNYVGGSGLRGEFQDEFLAYGRAGQLCVRCRTPLMRSRIAGRSTHYCPQCQIRG